MEATLDLLSSVSFREVEAYSDSPSPVLASGKGRLTYLRLRRLLVTESGGSQSSALPSLGPLVCFGLFFPSCSVSGWCWLLCLPSRLCLCLAEKLSEEDDALR